MPYDGCYITQEVPAAHVIIWSVATPVLSVRHLPVLFLSEWQLCAAHAVVRQPAEALLPGADGQSIPVFFPQSLVLLLQHDGADVWPGA